MNILTAVCLILGSFLGAGFVSGKEVACYFSQHGSVSCWSCVLCGLLFFLLIMFFFGISSNVKNTSEFVSVYFKKSSKLVEWLFAICILIFTGSMLAGTSALASSLEYNQTLIMSITVVLAFFVVINNVKGLCNVNIILVPVLILVLVITISGGEYTPVYSNHIVQAITSGGVYVFINIVTLGLLIIEIGNKYSKKEKLIISIISTVVITALLIGVNYSIITNDLSDNIMPNLFLSSRNSTLYIIMQIGIYVGLFTTLISNVFLLSGFVKKYIKSNTLSVLISLFLGLLISLCGFDNIVGFIYIFISFVGFGVVVIGLCKNKTKRDNNSKCVNKKSV